MGDLVIICTGGTPTAAGSPIPQYVLKIQTQSLLETPVYSYVEAAYAPVNITSRQLAVDGSSEALVLMDEPHSSTNPTTPLLVCGDAQAPATGGVCTITATGTGLREYNGSNGRPNVFQGKQIAPDTLQWVGIPFDPPGPNSSRVIRVTNVRVNASQAPLSTGISPTIIVFLSTLSSPVNVPIAGAGDNIGSPPGTAYAAFVQSEMSVTTNTPVAPVILPQCQSSNAFLGTNPAAAAATYTNWVRVKEGFASAFRRKNYASNGLSASTYPAGGDQNQNILPILRYFSSESGFENLGPTHDPSPNPPIGAPVPSTTAFPAINGFINAGVADQGTRVALIFGTVPSGVSLYVPATIAMTNPASGAVTGQAVLVKTDANGAGTFQPVASNGGSISNFDTATSGLAQVSLSAGSGMAVYEILWTDPFGSDQLSVPIALSYTAGQPTTGVLATVTVSTAPFFNGAGTADALSPIPRFSFGGEAGGTSWPLFAFEACGALAPTIALSSSASTANTVDALTFTASMSPVPSGNAQVTFYLDQTNLGVAAVGANGIAQLTTKLPLCESCMASAYGAHAITATYKTPTPGSVTISATTSVLVGPKVVLAVSNSGSNSLGTVVGAVYAPLSVTVTDVAGKPVANVDVTFSGTNSPGYGRFAGNGASAITIKSDASGVATATFLAGKRAGSDLVTVTAAGGTPIYFYLGAQEGPATSMLAVSGTTPQAVPINTAFYPPAILVTDAYGNGIRSFPVTFSAPVSGPGGSTVGTTVESVGITDGLVSVPFTANSIVGGPYTVTATANGFPPVVFSLTNTSADAPFVTGQPASRNAAVGNNVTLYASAVGQPAPSVQWQVNTGGGAFTDIGGATALTLTLSSVTIAMNGNQYRAVFTNSLGYSNSNPATLKVGPALPTLTWGNPADISVGTALSGTQLNATASVPGAFVYDPPAGTVLQAGTGRTLSVTFTPSDAVNYGVATKSVPINVRLAVPTVGVVGISPVTSLGLSQVFTFQFSQSLGYGNLNVLNVLINSALDGRQGCYVAYSLPANTLYLVNDAGDAGGPLAGSLTLNGSGSVGNSQCTIYGAGSAATGAGTNFSLTLNITFSASFAGNKVVYAAARDLALNNTGWLTMGTHGNPPLPTVFPKPDAMSPPSGAGANPVLTYTFEDANAATNIQTAWALINTAIDGRGACYVAYYRPANQVYLIPDSGDGTQATALALAGTGSVSNSQCTILAAGSSATVSGSKLTLNLNVAFGAGFTGPKGVWMAVGTLDGSHSAWEALGAWMVP